MAQFPFTTVGDDPRTSMPRLPLELSYGAQTVRIAGVVDSGASVSVLPYRVGSALGAAWDELEDLGPLAGNLSSSTTRALIVSAKILGLTGETGVELLFAWAESDSLPVLLGQIDFFMKYNVCIYRSQNYFEVWRRN